MPRHGKYGKFGKHLELFELFESWRDDPEAQTALAVEEGWVAEDDAEQYQTGLQESLEENGYIAEAGGTGAPEGRADFPLFLLTVTRHKLREGFRRRAARWQDYMGVERAEDFRLHTTSQLNGMTGMGPIPEFDEAPRLRTSEEAGPSYAVGKHGGIYGITFEMVVNDDTNTILNRTPSEMGRMSAAYVALVVAALIEANANWIDSLPFFTSTARQGLPTGNEYTGSAAEPTEDNLLSVLADMQNAVDAEGFPMDIDPGRIITKDIRVQNAIKRIIRSQQTSATETAGSATHVEKGTANPLQGILPDDAVLVEPYLKDPNDWIVLAETGRPAFIIAFLRDQREPFIGIEDPGVRSYGGGTRDPYTMDYDEMRMKIRHVFGVAQGDPRSARRMRRA